MTPAEHSSHVAAWYKRERRKQSRVAMLCVAAAASNGAKVTMADFMGQFASDEIGGAEE